MNAPVLPNSSDFNLVLTVVVFLYHSGISGMVNVALLSVLLEASFV